MNPNNNTDIIYLGNYMLTMPDRNMVAMSYIEFEYWEFEEIALFKIIVRHKFRLFNFKRYIVQLFIILKEIFMSSDF